MPRWLSYEAAFSNSSSNLPYAYWLLGNAQRGLSSDSQTLKLLLIQGSLPLESCQGVPSWTLVTASCIRALKLRIGVLVRSVYG